MRREIFSEEHEQFRDQFRRFVAKEVAPMAVQWNREGITPRAIWKRMGEEGYLGANQAVEYGGAGGDFLYDAIVMEELAYQRCHALQASLHTDICLPYLASYGSEAQKQKYLVPAIAGDCLVAIAMSEPAAGSDLAGVQTRALRDGDHYVVNGSKTFISNGQNCDLVIVVAKTDPTQAPRRHQPAARGGQRARLQAGPQPRQDRAQGPGHERDVLPGLPRARRESARLGRAGLQDADGEAAAGAALHRHLLDGLGAPLARRHDRVREGAARLRPQPSRRSRTRSSSSRSSRRSTRSARPSRTGCSRRTCAATRS